MIKTVRSRFNHEVGEKVEGCTILEKSIVSPPDDVERRRGIYDYRVEAAPAIVEPRPAVKRPPSGKASRAAHATR